MGGEIRAARQYDLVRYDPSTFEARSVREGDIGHRHKGSVDGDDVGAYPVCVPFGAMVKNASLLDCARLMRASTG